MKRKVLQASSKQIAAWQGMIKSGWQKSVSGIIENAKTIQKIHKQAKRVHGAWGKVFEGPGKPSFGPRTALMLIKIAEHPVLRNPKYTSRFPACWYSMHRLTQLRADRLELLIADGEVHAGMEEADVEKLLRLEDSLARQASRKSKAYNPKYQPDDIEHFSSSSSSKNKDVKPPDYHARVRVLRTIAVEFKNGHNKIRQDFSLWEAIRDAADGILSAIGDRPPVKSRPVKSRPVKSRPIKSNSTEPRTGAVH
jgi:hypothetical protein